MATLELKSRLAAGYTETALEYDAIAGGAYLSGLRRLLPLVRVPPQPSILDVGSGTGINLLELARVFGPCRLLAGIDLSRGMVAVAGAKAGMSGVVAAFQEGDAEDIPYPDGTFDLVVANSVYHWLPDRPRAAAEFARVLKPGGQLLLASATGPGFGEWTRLLEAALLTVFGPAAPPPFPDLPTPEQVAWELQAASFGLLWFHPVRQVILVTHPEAFVRMMDTVAPQWAAGLDPQARRLIDGLVVQWMRRLGPSGYPVTWTAVELVAVRLPDVTDRLPGGACP